MVLNHRTDEVSRLRTSSILLVISTWAFSSLTFLFSLIIEPEAIEAFLSAANLSTVPVDTGFLILELSLTDGSLPRSMNSLLLRGEILLTSTLLTSESRFLFT